jgi:signal transduction histidine kinase
MADGPAIRDDKQMIGPDAPPAEPADVGRGGMAGRAGGAAALIAAAVVAVALAGRTVTVPAWVLPPLAVAAGWTALVAVRLHRARSRNAGRRGWLLERERQAAAGAAIEQERARIARELHDIVSHNVSVMVVQAGAARASLTGTATTRAAGTDSDGDDLAEVLSAVEACGRDAMSELRNMLHLLAPPPDGSDPDLAPQPSMDRLGTLIDRVAFAGLPVEVTISGEPRPLPPGIDVAAYRVIQEALTNALKHATPGARAEVEVRYTGRNLRLEILTTGPSVLAHAPQPTSPRTSPHRSAPGEGPGAGRGLLGLRERVQMYGGDLHAGRRLGGGFRVRARIPLERP